MSVVNQLLANLGPMDVTFSLLNRLRVTNDTLVLVLRSVAVLQCCT